MDSKFWIPKSELCLTIFMPRLCGFQTPDSTHTSWDRIEFLCRLAPDAGFCFRLFVSADRAAPTSFIPVVLAAIFCICFGGSRRTFRASNSAIATVLRGLCHRRHGRHCRVPSRQCDHSVATQPISSRLAPLSPPLHTCCDGRDFFDLMLEVRCGTPCQTLGWSCHFGDTVFH